MKYGEKESKQFGPFFTPPRKSEASTSVSVDIQEMFMYSFVYCSSSGDGSGDGPGDGLRDGYIDSSNDGSGDGSKTSSCRMKNDSLVNDMKSTRAKLNLASQAVVIDVVERSTELSFSLMPQACKEMRTEMGKCTKDAYHATEIPNLNLFGSQL